MSKKKENQGLSIAREQRKGEHGALVDALILEPNIAGFGVDIKKVINWIKGKVQSNV
ncbi:hypothetical protein K9U73_027855 [Pseudomonas aeruginosa]|uniref:hypothetical protein n=1 Tax=Pseudomonas aeruginosa TaxID=287 RepID=UPI002ED486E2|nr:hypothetical protein K9U73_027855 [Pseudomonas aeruginosa]